MGTFGTTTNPAHYVEIADVLVAGQVKRPAAGSILKVRDHDTGGELADVTTQDYGYWSASYEGIDKIDVSGDDGLTWIGPLLSSEIMLAAASAGGDAAEALRVANETAAALAQGGGGGAVASVNGYTGAVTLTPGDIGARSAATPVPVAEVDGLALVGQTGKYSDLSGTPPTAIPLQDKGSPNGVATLGADGKLSVPQIPPNVGTPRVKQLSDGTWPLRNSVTADPDAIVEWIYYDVGTPDPQAGNGYVQGGDRLFKKV